MKNAAQLALTLFLLVLFVGMLGSLAMGPDRPAVMKQVAHLPDVDVDLRIFGNARRRSLSRIQGHATFPSGGAFSVWSASLDGPQWREATWPLTAEGQRPLPLSPDVRWRPAGPADRKEWLNYQGEPPPTKGKVLCYQVVDGADGPRGVPCDEGATEHDGWVWIGSDPEHHAVHVKVQSATLLGGTGILLFDVLAYDIDGGLIGHWAR